MYQYLVEKETGKIRMRGQGGLLRESAELALVQDAQELRPREWTYDFGKKKFLKKTKSQLKRERATKLAAGKAVAKVHAQRGKDFLELLKKQPVEIQQLFCIMAEFSSNELAEITEDLLLHLEK